MKDRAYFSDSISVNITRSILAIVCLFVFSVDARQRPGAAVVTSISEPQTDVSTQRTDRWTGFSTRHFRLYTSDDNGSAEAILRRLESARTFFERVGFLGSNDQSIVQIVEFGSDAEYASYGIKGSADAYYQRTQNCRFIITRDLSLNRYDVARPNSHISHWSALVLNYPSGFRKG